MIGEKIVRLWIGPINDDGLRFAVVGTDRKCMRAYPREILASSRFDVTNLIVRDFAMDGFDVGPHQEGMIAASVAAWQETHP